MPSVQSQNVVYFESSYKHKKILAKNIDHEIGNNIKLKHAIG